MTEMEKEKQEMEREEIVEKETHEDSAEETLPDPEDENTSEEVSLKEALQEASEKYTRLAADFQNYKRRTESERHEIAAYANERLVKDLLNVIDSFERALESKEEAGAGFRDGVELIFKQMMTVLTNFGVAEIPTDGSFDPNFHHAVLSESVEGINADTILMVMQKGYTLNGRVIRPAMVKVSV